MRDAEHHLRANVRLEVPAVGHQLRLAVALVEFHDAVGEVPPRAGENFGHADRRTLDLRPAARVGVSRLGGESGPLARSHDPRVGSGLVARVATRGRDSSHRLHRGAGLHHLHGGTLRHIGARRGRQRVLGFGPVTHERTPFAAWNRSTRGSDALTTCSFRGSTFHCHRDPSGNTPYMASPIAALIFASMSAISSSACRRCSRAASSMSRKSRKLASSGRASPATSRGNSRWIARRVASEPSGSGGTLPTTYVSHHWRSVAMSRSMNASSRSTVAGSKRFPPTSEPKCQRRRPVPAM